MLMSAAGAGSTMSHPDTGPPWATIVNAPLYDPSEFWVSVTVPGDTPSVPGEAGGDEGGGFGDCEWLCVGCGLLVGCDPPVPEPGCDAAGEDCGLPPTDPPLSLPERCLIPAAFARCKPDAMGSGAALGPMVAALTGVPPLWCSASSTNTVPVPSSAAATIATLAATVIVRTPYIRRGDSIGWGKPEWLNGAARRTTRSRYPTPAGERSTTRRKICSRRPAGTATIGSVLSSMAGLSSRRLRSPHTSHASMCRLTRWRSRMVSSPSHPARISSMPGQASRPSLATSSAPSDPSN